MIFKFLRGGKMEPQTTAEKEMREMLDDITNVTERYIESEMETASRWCWDHKEMFITFGDCFRAYMEQRK